MAFGKLQYDKRQCTWSCGKGNKKKIKTFDIKTLFYDYYAMQFQGRRQKSVLIHDYE